MLWAEVADEERNEKYDENVHIITTPETHLIKKNENPLLGYVNVQK